MAYVITDECVACGTCVQKPVRQKLSAKAMANT